MINEKQYKKNGYGTNDGGGGGKRRQKMKEIIQEWNLQSRWTSICIY